MKILKKSRTKLKEFEKRKIIFLCRFSIHFSSYFLLLPSILLHFTSLYFPLMTIYSFYLFNRSGVCLISRRFHQQAKSSTSLAHEERLMWGILFSLKDFSNKLATKPLEQLEKNPLVSFQTNEYKIHYFETLTGLRFVLCTDKSITIGTKEKSSTDPLQSIYRLYADILVRNPFYRVGQVIECPVFHQKLDQFIEELPYFAPATTGN